MNELKITPTINSIPIRHGDFSTATEALAYAAQGEAGFNFFNIQGKLTSVLTYRELNERSLKTASYLKTQGFERYNRLALIAETTPEFLVAFFACQYAGLIPCPVAFSYGPGSMHSYIEKLNRMLDRAEAKAIICSKNVANILRPTISRALLVNESLKREVTSINVHKGADDLSPLNAHEPAYIQFSSGSTTQPKGVLIRQSHLKANIHAVLYYGMQLRPEDRSFNWLPFHHNMGLVGFLLASVYGQRSVDCLSAEQFIQNPVIWLELMSKHKTNITFAPSFGYQLAAKKYTEMDNKPHLELSALRIAGIGGDVISAEVLKTFSSAFGTSNFKEQAFLPCYGLTETTLAVTVSDLDSDVITDSPEENNDKTLISCGRVLPGFEIKIVDVNDKRLLPERQVGQIWIKGPSVISSYIDESEKIPFDNDGFMYSGDLGYLSDGYLYISGREKDVIVIRGRNIWAQDIEWIIAKSFTNIGSNNVVVIGLNRENEEKLAIMVSITQLMGEDKKNLYQQALAIKKTVARETGIDSDIIYITNQIPLTNSGKVARNLTKSEYLSGRLTVIDYNPE